MSIGETLAAARVDAGLAVEDVSRETRVRSTIVRGIENDDFSLCGGEVYARGHIRNIANLLGVDPRPLIAEFDREHGGVPHPVENPAPAFDPEVAARSERGRPNWAAAMAVALTAICVIAGVQLASHHGSNRHGPVAGGSGASSPPAQPQPTQTPGPAPSGVVALVPPSGVHLHVSIVGATARSWLHIAGSSGQTLFEGILGAGTPSKNFTDPRLISMTIGNAGVVDLVVNGKDRGLAGGSGQVVHKTFHPRRSTSGAA